MSCITNKETVFYRVYRHLAFWSLNTLLLLVVLNIALGVWYFVQDKQRGEPLSQLSEMFPMSEYDTAAFDGLSIDTIRQINTDFNKMGELGMYYQPWVQFSEPLFQSQTLNVVTDETGIPMRSSTNPENAENHPVYKIYCFGGSTTFGYQVSDKQTYPVFLSQILNDSLHAQEREMYIEVANYGRGYYSPSEEIQLLIDLLKLGHRPSLVLFMDGLNLGHSMDVPHSTEVVVNRFYDIQFRPDAISLKQKNKFPMLRLAQEIRNKWMPENLDRVKLWEDEDNSNLVPLYANRFLYNKAIIQRICEFYEVPCLFYSQPVAPYNYPLQFYRNIPFEDTTERHLRGLLLQTILNKDSEIISLHHLFLQWNKKAIVDYTHYSPAFNAFVAKHLAEDITKKLYLLKPYVLDTTQATGIRRNIAEKVFEISQRNRKATDRLRLTD